VRRAGAVVVTVAHLTRLIHLMIAAERAGALERRARRRAEAGARRVGSPVARLERRLDDVVAAERLELGSNVLGERVDLVLERRGVGGGEARRRELRLGPREASPY
jgi:hypothetical protein